ncbi:hypothetical protein KIN20_009661 [Parelaphostrongylus tenuis]|uniref:Uncharacterized protein n=1 Tax=Parelaphostrongylus tenuis TaxID=148309 RepID=A0AAD5MSU3_PARTN|nr:hypothetical protein KIN20_009661 [Parelaphostrongylus tenuis]
MQKSTPSKTFIVGTDNASITPKKQKQRSSNSNKHVLKKPSHPLDRYAPLKTYSNSSNRSLLDAGKVRCSKDAMQKTGASYREHEGRTADSASDSSKSSRSPKCELSQRDSTTKMKQSHAPIAASSTTVNMSKSGHSTDSKTKRSTPISSKRSLSQSSRSDLAVTPTAVKKRTTTDSKSNMKKIVRSSRRYPCKGLCRYPHASNALGPTSRERKESSNSMKKLQPRDPYRPRVKSSTTIIHRNRVAKIDDKASSSTTSVKYNKNPQSRHPKRLSKISSTFTTPKKEAVDDLTSSSRLSSKTHKKLQPRDPYRPPKKSFKTKIQKDQAVQTADKMTSSLTESVEPNNYCQSQHPLRSPRKSSTVTISKKKVLDNLTDSSTKSTKSDRKLQPRDPYRPPRKFLKTTLVKKQSVDKITLSSRTSLSSNKELQPRESSEKPSSKTTTALKQISDRKAADLNASLRSSPKPKVRSISLAIFTSKFHQTNMTAE